MSQEFCIRMRVSISTPNAFSMRIAISGERLAFAFRREDKVGRETRRTFAASVTDSLWASMISVFMNRPG
jgi:hypothetical protein